MLAEKNVATVVNLANGSCIVALDRTISAIRSCRSRADKAARCASLAERMCNSIKEVAKVIKALDE